MCQWKIHLFSLIEKENSVEKFQKTIDNKTICMIIYKSKQHSRQHKIKLDNFEKIKNGGQKV